MSATRQEVVQHLLFHKSLIDESDGGSRIGEYLTMVEASGQGDHVVMTDPFDRTVALCLQLVIDEHMDPWNIDLVRFAHLYLARLRETPDVDLISAGRLILMAWSILKMQSDDVVRQAEAERNRVEEASVAWDAIDAPEWMTDDADYAFTQHVLGARDAPIDEKVRHRGDRKVTLKELVDALEQARQEAAFYVEMNRRRADERARWKVESRTSVSGMMHKEDLEEEIRIVWGRINTFNGHPIPFDSLHDASRDDFVRALVSVLFLSREGKTAVSQEDFPYGDIYVTNLAPGSEAPDLAADDLASVRKRVPADLDEDERKEEPPEEGPDGPEAANAKSRNPEGAGTSAGPKDCAGPAKETKDASEGSIPSPGKAIHND